MNQQSIGGEFGQVLSVAVAVPLRQSFDFLAPINHQEADTKLIVGARVKVQFGARQLFGVVLEVKDTSDYPMNKLKPVLETWPYAKARRLRQRARKHGV